MLKGDSNKVELLMNMTIGGTVTAGMLLLVKTLLKNKLTPKWHLYLWIILAVRLMIPGLPESDISLLNAIPRAQNVTTVESIAAPVSEEAATIESGYVEGNIIMKSPITGTEQRRAFSFPEQRVNGLFFGWLMGVILMAAYLMGAYVVFYHKTKKLPECKNAQWLELLMECKAEAGIASDKITLRLGGTTPMLQGIIKPTIIVPEGYSKEELRHVLIHELCHYKHKDILVNIICCAFLCIYWFNPIMWLCFYMIRRDIEILCDERVVEIIGERKEYALTLLKTALKKNQFLFATTSMQNGEKEVAKRIKHIAYFRKPKLWISMLALVVIIATGVICLTNASVANTVNLDVGGGYFVKIPAVWAMDIDGDGDLAFYDEEGLRFGGTSMIQIDLGENKMKNFESVSLPIPNDSQVLERKVIKEEDEYTILLVNLNRDLATSVLSENNKINQNYIFILPNENRNEVYSLWAISSQVTERELIKIARTLQESPYPQGYQPETSYQDDWTKTAGKLVKDYFDNYVNTEMSMTSDISGYQIDYMEPFEDQEASWSLIHPNVAVFRVDYTLKIAYPEQYSFPGGGFEIGEGNKTKIYKDQLAIFQKDDGSAAKFLGFVWPQDIEELGEAMSILHTIKYADVKLSPEAMLALKMPYIGDHTKVGRIVRSLPLSQYSAGLELYTKEEPYGLTVNYDLTEMGDMVFESRPEKAMTDSSGWDVNPYLNAQLYRNSAILLSLIDNCSTVELKVTGLSETDVPYTYSFNLDREFLSEALSQDPRKYTESLEAYTEFLNDLELSQLKKGNEINGN